MIEPFGFSRLWLLRKLGSKGTPLGLQRALTRPASPFWRELSSYLPVYESNIRTYVVQKDNNGSRMAGVAQICEHPARPEAEIVYLAPALSTHPDVRDLWTRLLGEVCKRAGEQGLLRVFAAVLWGSDEMDVFRQASFVDYAREDILRLDGFGPVRRTFPLSGVRRLQYGDESRLADLYEQVTPRHVQWAEGQSLPRSWAEASNQRGFRGEEAYVLENETNGTIAALLHISPGKTGHWLEIARGPDGDSNLDDLLDFALERIANWPTRPVYTAVRAYMGGILPALYARGFEPCAQQAAMMKNTAVWLKDPFQPIIPVVKKQVGPSTPTVTLLNGEVISESSSHPVAASVGTAQR